MSASTIILLLIPFSSALIGWLTNKLAVTMLFNPREPRNILGYTLHGLVPRRQDQLAEEAGEIIEREFFNHHHLRELIQQVDIDPKLERLADHLVTNRLIPKIHSIPLVGKRIGTPKLQDQLQIWLSEELKNASEPLLVKVADDIEKDLDVKTMVAERIAALDPNQLEKIVRETADRELQSIELMGAILGFIVGLIQLGLFLLAAQF